ncbi:hypothetical protein AB1Y20_006246 [Prymnesium parvum]|uniref:Mediator complex subunit 10 n=1 Tax=Prymnesium parvum TaxID=97485 RepID=A0AB34J5E9_PRYPA|mmetsp:Transcript_36994/g.92048  ORF Transcript_36994/g.92048 Transcript_36994/m.92048 type:complete len:203 (-) Transcript_36994:52-660(-)
MARSEAEKLLAEVSERAGDLSSTLRGMDTRRMKDVSSMLAQFQQLASQLESLHEQASNGMLAQYLVLPHELTADMSTIPALLSTRLDKEHEEQTTRLKEEAANTATGKAPSSAEMDEYVKSYNKLLTDAQERLANLASNLDLPKAPIRRGSIPTPSPAPAAKAASVQPGVGASDGQLLLDALRNGEGLRARPGVDVKRQKLA